MRFSTLLHHSYQKIRLVDVGCRGGIHPRWSGIRNLEVIGFEPDAKECGGLQAGRYFPIALYSRGGTVKFYVTVDRNCSSIYAPNPNLMSKFVGSDHLAVEKVVEVPCDTLDHVLESNGLRDVDFLKVDAQGAELDVLHGAEKTLEGVVGVECEVEFSPIYLNQPLFPDVDTFLRERGFTLLDLEVCRYFRSKKIRSKGQVLYADALYFRDETMLLEHKIPKAMMIARIYGYYDIAGELEVSPERRL